MLPVSITLTRHDEPDWLIRETLDSLGRQRGVAGEVLFLDQQDDPETATHCGSLSTQDLRFTVVNVPAGGLSPVRNRAIELAANDIILFIDSDAVADPGWAAALAHSLTRDTVGVVGGRVVPRWHRPPGFVSRAPIIQEQYSLIDLGPDEGPCAKIVGANFGLHRGRLGEQAFFDTDLGRRPGSLLGGEETDLCARVRGLGLEVCYNGAASVEHQILPERINLAWVQRRIFYAGVGRALQGGLPNPYHGGRGGVAANLGVIPVLPAYALGMLKGLWMRGTGRAPRGQH